MKKVSIEKLKITKNVIFNLESINGGNLDSGDSRTSGPNGDCTNPIGGKPNQ
jgi:hypothetical protein